MHKQVTKSTWVGDKFFHRVCQAFKDRGYTPPNPDVPGANGAYVMNIAQQYMADLTEEQVIGIICSVQFVRE